MTRMDRINELEAAALRIQRNPDNIIGGLKAFNSGYETHLKPAAQRKLDKINSEMGILLDAAIQEIHQQEPTGAHDMKQYEFSMINKRTGRPEHARATAANAVIAHAQIVLAYGTQFAIAELHSATRPPHYTAGEIDCADFPAADTAWLIQQADQIQGA